MKGGLLKKRGKLGVKSFFTSFFIFLVFVSAYFFVNVLQINAGNGSNVLNWIWGGGTGVAGDGTNTNIGWISMNSLNCDANGDGFSDQNNGTNLNCPANGTAISDYGVNVPSGNGDLSGYAWSENIGWLSFSSLDLAGCPTGTCSARRVGSNLEGWSRVMSISQAGVNSGGWTGWISLRGSNYGVSIDADNNLSGYAWSDELGWVRFDGARINVPKTLKICEVDNSGNIISSTPISVESQPVNTINIVEGTSKYLRAYLNTASDCGSSSNEVTDGSIWSETNLPNDAVDILAGNPRTLQAKSVDANAMEGVNVTYDDSGTAHALSFNVNVINNLVACWSCNPGFNCESNLQDSCTSEQYSDESSCLDNCNNPGFNWREVSP